MIYIWRKDKKCFYCAPKISTKSSRQKSGARRECLEIHLLIFNAGEVNNWKSAEIQLKWKRTTDLGKAKEKKGKSTLRCDELKSQFQRCFLLSWRSGNFSIFPWVCLIVKSIFYLPRHSRKLFIVDSAAENVICFYWLSRLLKNTRHLWKCLSTMAFLFMNSGRTGLDESKVGNYEVIWQRNYFSWIDNVAQQKQ